MSTVSVFTCGLNVNMPADLCVYTFVYSYSLFFFLSANVPVDLCVYTFVYSYSLSLFFIISFSSVFLFTFTSTFSFFIFFLILILLNVLLSKMCCCLHGPHLHTPTVPVRIRLLTFSWHLTQLCWSVRLDWLWLPGQRIYPRWRRSAFCFIHLYHSCRISRHKLTLLTHPLPPVCQ